MEMNRAALLIKLRREVERIGFTEVARRSGVPRAHLYSVLNEETGNPTLRNLLLVAEAVGLELFWRVN